MHAHRLRFQPPEVDLSPAMQWVLRRAFGPAGPARSDVPPQAGSLARRLGLAGRIAARAGWDVLLIELGHQEAALLWLEHAGLLAQDRLRAAVIGEIAEAAETAQVGTPVVFLKFAAQRLTGASLPGSRGACDVDVLTSSERAAGLLVELHRRGYAPSGLPASEHHLSPVFHPARGMVEVHLKLLGVRLKPGAPSASFADLQRGDWLRVAEPSLRGSEPMARSLVPSPEVMLAHCLVHGLAQHGLAPDSYPLWRMFADLVDLAWPDATPEVEERVRSWIARDVAAPEVDAAAALCRHLVAGETPARPGAARALLDHALAGALDDRYVRSLRPRLFSRPLSDRSPLAASLAAIGRTLFPNAAQMTTLYGPTKTPWRRWVRRLWRPVDLSLRLLEYLQVGPRTQ